ncbi:hypothetical protein [Spirillospora sp. CA-294931]|uniref:hypothetical protein n=1 Tax=Spirillospora sp. CA-294931 TaxID=3240042 RepID=UPI003D92AFF5
MTEEGPITLELALSELRRDIDVGMAGMEGRLALLFQRNELQERQVVEQARVIDELADRLATAEREQVTRGHLDNRFRHTVATLSMLAAAASAAVALVAIFLSP